MRERRRMFGLAVIPEVATALLAGRPRLGAVIPESDRSRHNMAAEIQIAMLSRFGPYETKLPGARLVETCKLNGISHMAFSP